MKNSTFSYLGPTLSSQKLVYVFYNEKMKDYLPQIIPIPQLYVYLHVSFFDKQSWGKVNYYCYIIKKAQLL